MIGFSNNKKCVFFNIFLLETVEFCGKVMSHQSHFVYHNLDPDSNVNSLCVKVCS